MEALMTAVLSMRTGPGAADRDDVTDRSKSVLPIR